MINCTVRVAYSLLDMKIHLEFELKRLTHPSIPFALLIISGHKALLSELGSEETTRKPIPSLQES